MRTLTEARYAGPVIKAMVRLPGSFTPLPSTAARLLASSGLHRLQQGRSEQLAAGTLRKVVAAAGSSDAAAGAAEPIPAAPPKPRQAFSYCRMCGGPIDVVRPEGDNVWRHVCTKCGFIDYQNPRVVVGCIVQHEGSILLVRRGIEPQRGLWTVPAGYLECGESSAAGAARETWEEAGARVAVEGPFCHYDIPAISQIYVLFRGRLAPPHTFAARLPESLEVRLFAPEDIPFDSLAFSSVAIALRSYLADLRSGRWTVHHGVITKRAGAGPNEAGSFQLEGHYELPTRLPST